MWAYIINVIYDQSCEKCLTDLARHQHLRMIPPAAAIAMSKVDRLG
jgi:hypothetical protein